jgi:uncharacterized protein (UPF0335 family)
MIIGHNTASGEALTRLVERVEGIRADKKQLSEEEAAVMAEAKAAGFVPAGIRYVVKARAMKPQDREEAEAVRDQYMFALGMISELPLFKAASMLDVDTASRESVIEALKQFVPDNGSIVIEAGGRPVRLTRDGNGEVIAREVSEPPAPKPAPAAGPGPAHSAIAKAPPPDVDAEGAEALGAEAYRANAPIITNPFPFGDPRRARWDVGWRRASGTDGMGPSKRP